MLFRFEIDALLILHSGDEEVIKMAIRGGKSAILLKVKKNICNRRSIVSKDVAHDGVLFVRWLIPARKNKEFCY